VVGAGVVVVGAGVVVVGAGVVVVGAGVVVVLRAAVGTSETCKMCQRIYNLRQTFDVAMII